MEPEQPAGEKPPRYLEKESIPGLVDEWQTLLGLRDVGLHLRYPEDCLGILGETHCLAARNRATLDFYVAEPIADEETTTEEVVVHEMLHVLFGDVVETACAACQLTGQAGDVLHDALVAAMEPVVDKLARALVYLGSERGYG